MRKILLIVFTILGLTISHFIIKQRYFISTEKYMIALKNFSPTIWKNNMVVRITGENRKAILQDLMNWNINIISIQNIDNKFYIVSFKPASTNPFKKQSLHNGSPINCIVK